MYSCAELNIDISILVHPIIYLLTSPDVFDLRSRAAFVFASGSVKWKGEFIAAALFDWIVSTSCSEAVLIPVETASIGVKVNIPIGLIKTKLLGQLTVTLAHVSATSSHSIGALNGFLACSVFRDQIKRVANFFANALATFGHGYGATLFNQTVVTLFEVETSPINRIQRSSIAPRGNVVTSFWQAVASVVAITTELIGDLKPQNENFQVSELSSLLLTNVPLIGTHQSHYLTLQIIVLFTGQLNNQIKQLIRCFVATDTVRHLEIAFDAVLMLMASCRCQCAACNCQ